MSYVDVLRKNTYFFRGGPRFYEIYREKFKMSFRGTHSLFSGRTVPYYFLYKVNKSFPPKGTGCSCSFSVHFRNGGLSFVLSSFLGALRSGRITCFWAFGVSSGNFFICTCRPLSRR